MCDYFFDGILQVVIRQRGREVCGVLGEVVFAFNESYLFPKESFWLLYCAFFESDMPSLEVFVLACVMIGKPVSV